MANAAHDDDLVPEPLDEFVAEAFANDEVMRALARQVLVSWKVDP